MRRFAVLCFVAGAALLASGCAQSPRGHVAVPAVPAWQIPAGAATFSGAAVLAEIQRIAPSAQIETSDAVFTPVSHAWLEETVAWSLAFGTATGLGIYEQESWDCDKFALAFALSANIAAKRAGVKAQPLVARIYVVQAAAFGGVASGGFHALNAFRSDRGIFVMEPQTRTLVPLAAYPNRDFIIRVKLGG